jgi:hypothetical protein
VALRKEYVKGNINLVPAVLDRLQDQLSPIINNILSDLLFGRKVITVNLAVGNNVIAHDLRREPTGWIVVDQLNAAVIYRVSWNPVTLVLNSSAAGTVKLIIF